MLKDDHQKVKKLLNQLERVASDDARRGEQLLRQIETEVKIHSRLEEEIFYPAFQKAVDGKKKDEKLFFEAHEEHHIVDIVFAEAKDERAGTPEFAAKAKVIKDLIEHHVEEEETEMFPKSRKAISAQGLRDLARQMKGRKQELMGQAR